MSQIAFHLEVGVETPGEAIALQLAAELALQGLLRKVGDVGRHPRHGQALLRPDLAGGVFAAAPVGIGVAAFEIGGEGVGRDVRAAVLDFIAVRLRVWVEEQGFAHDVVAAVLGAPISTILIVFEMTTDYAVTLAVMVGTVTAAALTCSLAGHDSIFAGQLARRSVAVPDERPVAPLHLARVGDVLRTDPPTVPWHLSLAEAAAALRAAPCAEVVVLDGDRGVVGMLTAADLLGEGISAGTLARKDIPRLTPADDLRTALDAFALAGAARLPVVDGGRLVGIVHERDVLAAWHRAAEKTRA